MSEVLAAIAQGDIARAILLLESEANNEELPVMRVATATHAKAMLERGAVGRAFVAGNR